MPEHDYPSRSNLWLFRDDHFQDAITSIVGQGSKRAIFMIFSCHNVSVTAYLGSANGNSRGVF
jgi:hypothetical protein